MGQKNRLAYLKHREVLKQPWYQYMKDDEKAIQEIQKTIPSEAAGLRSKIAPVDEVVDLRWNHNPLDKPIIKLGK